VEVVVVEEEEEEEEEIIASSQWRQSESERDHRNGCGTSPRVALSSTTTK
jgi:hypothetical protein